MAAFNAVRRVLFAAVLSMPPALPADDSIPAAQAPQATVPTLQGGTRAQPLKSVYPDYPDSAKALGQEGWVVLSFAVKPDGRVADPVVEDSSGLAAFEKAALRSIIRQRYEPATWNGKPIEQCAARQRYIFQIRRPGRSDRPIGARSSFIREYKAAAELAEANKPDAAEEKLDQLTKGGAWNNYEAARLWLFRASLQALKGDKQGQLRSLRKALFSGEYSLESNLYSEALRHEFALQVQMQRYGDALATYRKLRDAKKPGDLAPYEKIVAEINALIDGDKPLSATGLIEFRSGCEEGRPNYQHELLRREFAFDVPKGKASDFELRCDWRRIVDKVDPDRTWKVPDSWGWCQLFVFGDTGSEVKIIEYPLDATQKAKRMEPLKF